MKKIKYLFMIMTICFILQIPSFTVHAESTSELYCLYNPITKEYLYTVNPDEKDALSTTWSYEGVVCTVPTVSNTPIYRLYNSVSNSHLYTGVETEVTQLVSEGWQNEGVSFYVDEDNTVPIYRMHHETVNTHLFCRETAVSTLENRGWTCDGIAFYASSANEEFEYSNISLYNPWEIGVMVLSESHAGVMEEAHAWYNDDTSLSIPIPKMNVVFVGRPSEYEPLWFSGGITHYVNGIGYECFTEINNIMATAPDVKFWYLVWFMGSNDVTKRGLDVAVDAMKANVLTLDEQEFVTPHTMALITTPHKYGKTYEKYLTRMDQYDDIELEFFKNIGYGDRVYDSRDDFDSFIQNGHITGKEYKGYVYPYSGDGVHFYASQYWQVISNAINVIIK